VERREVRTLAYFLPLFVLTMALCTKAWVDGVAGHAYAWVKTPRAPALVPGEVRT
jgi:1,2-diacylglycerol 3-beta-glucosyltransferase